MLLLLSYTAVIHTQNQSIKILPWIVYLLLAAVLVYPFLAYEYMFAADQYVHGYNTCILEEIRSNPSSYYADWLHINTFPEPNWIGHGLLWVLAKALPTHLAEKAFVLLLVIGNGYAFLTSKSALSPQLDFRCWNFAWPWKTATALLSLIFLFGAIWQLGFVNYLFGMVAVIVGLTHTSRLKSDQRLAVAGWGVFTYFCHPISFLFFLGTFSLRELLGRNLLSVYLKPLSGDWGAFLKRFVIWFGIPILLLVVYIATHSEVSTLKGASPWRLLGLAYYHNDLALFSVFELNYAKLALFVAVIVSLYGILLLRKFEKAWTLSAVGAAVLIAAIVFAPDYFAGGALIHQRLLPFVFVWAFWCAAHAYSRQTKTINLITIRLGTIMVLLSGISIVGLTHYRNQALPAIAEVLDEFKEFSKEIPQGSTLLPVSASATAVLESQQLSLKPVLHHFAATLDCTQEVVLLDNYEAYVGYFPLLWNEGKNPFKSLSNGLEEHPARLKRTSEPWLLENVDYILAMGPVQKAFVPETFSWVSNSFGESRSSTKQNFHLIKIERKLTGKD